MQLSQSTFAARLPKTISFNYFSPKHVSTVLFSSKQAPPKTKAGEQTENTLKLSLADCLSPTSHCGDDELDTTLDTLKDVAPWDHRNRKPLARSVLVPANSSNQDFDENSFCSRLTEAGDKNSQLCHMKKSCMPGSVSQSQVGERWPLWAPGKENAQFVKNGCLFKKGQPLTFTKQKLQLKKPSPKLSNARVEDFEVGSMLGKGSIGRVYLAKHKITNCYFALKKVAKNEVKDLEQFVRGVKYHFFLEHPHLVQLYACFSDNEYVYLLMELCVDGNLAKEKKNIRHHDERNRVLLGVAKGLQAMHRQCIRHGDLKLENIMISFGFAKLTDLDCACRFPSPTSILQRQKNQLWGSPAYFSPEMVRHCTFSLLDDVWALGVVAYQLFAGSQPFGLWSTDDLYKVVEKEMCPLPVCVKEKTRALIGGLLSKEGKSRVSLQFVIEQCMWQLSRGGQQK